jgi:oligopeptide/dipeptide ABC transporter ATP-binding protein
MNMGVPVERASGKLAEIRGLTVKHLPDNGRPVWAVNEVTLHIDRGEVVGILGESGSGKSTLAAAMLRMLPSNAEHQGSILFEGVNLLSDNEPELRNIRGARLSLIPQDPAVSLNPVIKAGEQISEVLRAHLPMNRKQRKSRVEELLREVGFDDPQRIYAAYPHQLSGGQRQRVVIAQAMACRPALVIADEPTSKLDAPLQTQILALMSNLIRRNGTALILITHDPAILTGFADRIAVMYAGRIVEDGPGEAILRKPLHPYTQALMRLTTPATPNNRSHFPAIAGEPADLTRVGAGCCFEPRCAERMPVCADHHPQESKPESLRRVSCFKYGN